MSFFVLPQDMSGKQKQKSKSKSKNFGSGGSSNGSSNGSSGSGEWTDMLAWYPNAQYRRVFQSQNVYLALKVLLEDC